MPITDYLTRSVAALYGFLGVLLLLVSGNPVRYKPIVQYVGWMNIVFGIALVAIDVHARLPTLWIVGEGPPIVGFGLVVLYMSRHLGEVHDAGKPAVPPQAPGIRLDDREPWEVGATNDVERYDALRPIQSSYRRPSRGPGSRCSRRLSVRG